MLTGTGTLTFSGTAGTATPAIDTINVEGPTVVVNGAMTGATINVRAGSLKGVGPLGGITTIGDGTGNDDANLSPGNGVGVLGIGGLALDTDARLQVELDRLTATADKIVADGPVELGVGTATLALSILNSGALAPGTVFLIIDNSSTGHHGAASSAATSKRPFVVDGLPFTINYNAGADLNDVVLTYVPEPGSGTLLATGFLSSRDYVAARTIQLRDDRAAISCIKFFTFGKRPQRLSRYSSESPDSVIPSTADPRNKKREYLPNVASQARVQLSPIASNPRWPDFRPEYLQRPRSCAFYPWRPGDLPSRRRHQPAHCGLGKSRFRR